MPPSATNGGSLFTTLNSGPSGCPALQSCNESLEKGITLEAVHNAMIDGKRHVATRLRHDTIGRIDDRPLLDLADAENCRLPLVDHDRRGQEAAAHAMIGDRER